MDNKILVLSEFLEKVGVELDMIAEWEKHGLLHPMGYSEEKGVLFNSDSIAVCQKIKKLLEVGYEIDEIQKIIKRVGLPKKGVKPASRKKEEFLTVGTLADRVGVSPRTIKHWEEKGIIAPDMRSEGGFRLYSKVYVEACKRIRDLQLLGFSLEQIKEISDRLREFLTLQDEFKKLKPEKVEEMLKKLSGDLNTLFDKMRQLKTGILRWEDLLRKQKREITSIKAQNKKRIDKKEGEKNAKNGVH